MYEINWRGDKCKNYYNTRHTPIGICNHITAGTQQSVYWWFTSPNNTQGSAHYVVSRKGEIDQYVDIRKSAWAQGLVAEKANYERSVSPMVRDRPMINPNYYLVSIEFEGYVEGAVDVNGNGIIDNYGLDGNITEEQFQAGVWLHKWIQAEVERIWNHRIQLNSYYVEGHFRIDPKRKPNCPGPAFPWNRLYSELARVDHMTLAEYEEDVQYRKSTQSLTADAYVFLSRFKGLRATRKDPRHGAEAERKIMLMAPVMVQMGLQGDITVDSILKRIDEVEAAAISDGQWRPEGVRKLNIGIAHAKNMGLIA